MDRFDQYDIDPDYGDDYGYGRDDRDDDRDDYGDDYGDDYVDGPGMQATFDQQMHSSIADECGGLPVDMGNNMTELTRNINQLVTDPVDRFKSYVGAISHKMTEDTIFDVSIKDRNAMCLKANNLDKIKYLNPTAYIVGYIVTNGSKEIDKKLLKKLLKKSFTKLNLLTDDSVKPADVVRYARYWNKIGKDN